MSLPFLNNFDESFFDGFMAKYHSCLLRIFGKQGWCSLNHFFAPFKVFSKAGEEFKSIDDIENETYINEGYKKTMFPPTAEENEKINLQRW